MNEDIDFSGRGLLSLKEVCAYTGWGASKAREILLRGDSKFTVFVGNRLYVNKKLFDKWLDHCAEHQIKI